MRDMVRDATVASEGLISYKTSVKEKGSHCLHSQVGRRKGATQGAGGRDETPQHAYLQVLPSPSHSHFIWRFLFAYLALPHQINVFLGHQTIRLCPMSRTWGLTCA